MKIGKREDCENVDPGWEEEKVLNDANDRVPWVEIEERREKVNAIRRN